MWPWPFLFFAASAASVADAAVTAAAASAASTADAAVTAAADAAVTAAADADLQYLQGAGIRNRHSATADSCATNELHLPPKTNQANQI